MCQNVAGTYSDTAGTRRIPEQKLESSIKGRKKVNIFAEEILLSDFSLKLCEKLACLASGPPAESVVRAEVQLAPKSVPG